MEAAPAEVSDSAYEAVAEKGWWVRAWELRSGSESEKED